jgi:hypothetical protein
MADFWRIILGLAIMVAGFHIVWKTAIYQDFTGPIEFAERRMGPGQTSTFLKLVGVLVCFVGMAVATNWISDILTSVAGIFVRGR